MFSFFFPWMWLALPALGIPLWLHMTRRNDSRTIRFSAMQFLDDQPVSRRRPLLPHNLPLLFLRLLLLSLIMAAFAWPYIPLDTEALIQESRVYILDNTLSNQAAGEFEASQKAVADALEAAGIETQIAVVELTNEPQVVVQFGDDRLIAARRIRDLPPGYHRGSYAAAFRVAQALLDQALGEHRKIVLLSDSQQNQWEAEAAIPPFLQQTDMELPKPKQESLANLALRQPVARRTEIGGHPLVQCSFSIYRQGRTGAPEVRVLVNGQEVLQNTFELSPAEGEQTLLVELEDQPDVWLHGEVRLQAEGDSLPADNRVFFSLPPIRLGRVALLADSVYLRTALSQHVISGRWSSELLSPAKVADHQPADVLCLESRFLAEPEVRNVVDDYLHGGRGVMLLLGGDSLAVSGLLRDFGIELLPDEQHEAAPFRYVFQEHAIFQPFRSSETSYLHEILLQRYRVLRSAKATPLAFSAAGDPVLLEARSGRGRLLVFAFQFDRAETNWPLHPSFPPFLDSCLKHLRAPDEQVVIDYLPGETCVWQLPRDHLRSPGNRPPSNQQVELVRYGNVSQTLRVPVREGQVRFPMPAEPGNYDLRLEGDDPLQVVLNVNPPPDESQLTFRSGDETLGGWRRPLSDDESAKSAPATLSDLTRQEILRQHLWWWLLVVGLLVLMAETVWVASKRSLAPAQEIR